MRFIIRKRISIVHRSRYWLTYRRSMNPFTNSRENVKKSFIQLQLFKYDSIGTTRDSTVLYRRHVGLRWIFKFVSNVSSSICAVR